MVPADRRRAGGNGRLEAVEAAATVLPRGGFSGRVVLNVDAKELNNHQLKLVG
jgi:hypothetical protein